MEISELKKRIGNLVEAGQFDDIIKVLKDYRLHGGDQLEAYKMLEKMMFLRREQNDEKLENIVLEIMYIVSGFCSQEKRIWDNNIKF